MRFRFPGVLVLLICGWLAGSPAGAQAASAEMLVESAAFKAGQAIPARFSCEGRNTSPALTWADIPSGTKTFAVLVDDPDAPGGDWIHWVFYNLPASLSGLPEGIAKKEKPSGGGVQGRNSFEKTGYDGPCPPPGSPHHYYFHVYALDTDLKLAVPADANALKSAMQGHILGEGELMGTFQR